MSVAGPRPERPELDANILLGVVERHKLWFVNPGLTELAQINNVTGHKSGERLRHDVQYVRKFLFWSDTKIMLRQKWKVIKGLT